MRSRRASNRIAVGVRVRPLLPDEVARDPSICWRFNRKSIQVADPQQKNQNVFEFGKYLVFLAYIVFLDVVFGVNSTNAEVYEISCRDVVFSCLEGFNACIMAYGQTSSGKTHTMTGIPRSEPGVIPLSIRDLFSGISERPTREFIIRASYVEIYNERIIDLLDSHSQSNPTTGGSSSDSGSGGGQHRSDSSSSEVLSIREDPLKGIVIVGLTEHRVHRASDILSLFARGDRRRHFGSTGMNERSSRSHTIFRIVIESRRIPAPPRSANAESKSRVDADGDVIIPDDSAEDENVCDQDEKRSSSEDSRDLDSSSDFGAIRVSCLNLVDLAGSEKSSKAKTSGVRLTEGGHINQSLLVLGRVIHTLSTMTGSERTRIRIPYRDSKLTRILQPALGHNSKTSMICAITPARQHIDESFSTLLFASRAKTIVNRAKVNEVFASDSAMIELKRKVFFQRKKNQESEGLILEMREQNVKLMKERDFWKAKFEEKSSTIEQESGLASQRVRVSGMENELRSLRAEVHQLRIDLQDVESRRQELEEERDTMLEDSIAQAEETQRNLCQVHSLETEVKHLRIERRTRPRPPEASSAVSASSSSWRRPMSRPSPRGLRFDSGDGTVIMGSSPIRRRSPGSN